MLGFCLCSCIPFAILIVIIVLIPPTEAQVITYVQHQSTLLQYSKRDLQGGGKLQQLCAVCLCFSNEQRDNAAALSCAHWCCSPSDSVNEQWDADPVKCPEIVTSERFWLIFDFWIYGERLRGTMDLAKYWFLWQCSCVCSLIKLGIKIEPSLRDY